MTQPVLKHPQKTRAADITQRTNSTTPPGRTPNVPLLACLLLIGLPSYATGNHQRDARAAWSAAPEIAPLPPPLTRHTGPKDTAIAPTSIDEQSGRLRDELFGGDPAFVDDAPAGCVAGGAAFDSPKHHRCRIVEKLAQLRHRLKAKRADRRAARTHRRHERPIITALRDRRIHH